MEEKDKIAAEEIFVEYAGDESITVDDIVDLIKLALHPVDIDILATKLDTLTCKCECGNLVFDDDESCEACNAEFTTEETETPAPAPETVAV